MATELVQLTGSYASCQASTSTGTGALCGGAVTAIGTAIASEDLYSMLDFKVANNSGTPVAGGTVDIYRRAGDGTDQADPPVYADHLQTYVGSVTFDNVAATTHAYLYGVANPDPNDTYYMVNETGATLTIQLYVRGRTFQPAA